LTRPIFLLGGALLFGLGTVVALYLGSSISLSGYLLGQLMVTSIQLTAQYANEYHDLNGDRLNAANRTWFTGGSGVLPRGEISTMAAWQAVRVAGVIAVICIFLAGSRIPLTGILGIFGLVGAWFYSSPPFSLMGSGWGELTASVIVALLVPLTGFASQTGYIHPLLLLISMQLVLIHIAMLVAFELPDWEADSAVDKRTIRVRFGLPKTVQLHSTLLIASFAFLIVFQVIDLHPARFIWFALPLSIFQMFQVARTLRVQPLSYRWLTLGAVGMFVLTVSLWIIGFLFE
jgi:1,4-dihydroxy-2-naphthoate polyprenyltransferase